MDDRLPQPPRQFTCEGCGSSVEYAPGTATLRCPHCGREQAVPASGRSIVETNDTWFGAPHQPVATVGQHQFACHGCGAPTATTDLSSRCPFCAAPLVAESPLDGLIVPAAVLPFGLDQARAREAFAGWVRSRWFAPGTLKKVGSTEQLAGTYVPHWTYDSATHTYYLGERGEYYYVTETYTETVDGREETRTRQVRHTRWYPASGTVSREFDDVLILATNGLAPARIQKLDPWPLTAAQAYEPAYLSGYRTLRYDVDPDTGLSTAKSVMTNVIAGDCRADIGGDEQRVHSMDTAYWDIMFKLLLLPVWLGSYNYAGRSWQVFVNAYTGEVLGDRPISRIKVALAVIAALILVIAVLLVMHLRQS